MKAMDVLRVDLDWLGVFVHKGITLHKSLCAGAGHMAIWPEGIIGEQNERTECVYNAKPG